jgi:hypothetical protein
MNHRAEYLLQVLEKIGAPLLASVIAVNARGTDSALHNEAQKIAELLAKTVQTSIDMSYALDLGPTGGMTDSIRVALAGLAGPLVAQFFQNNAKTPGDPEIKRLVAALQAVLSFAENFEANSENSDRLRDISANGGRVDAAQTHVQYIQAFIPVIGAVGAFPFGQPEQKLIMEVSSRLAAKAEQLRQSMFGELGDGNKRAELGILKTLAEIYAACHRAETAKLQGMDDDRRAAAGLSTDTLWKNFDLQTAMLEALAQGIVSGTSTVAATGSSGGGPKPAEPPPVEIPLQSAMPPPAAPQAPPAQSSGSSPMSFFKSPPKEGG